MKTKYPISNYVVWDVETTGLNAGIDTVIQMSALKIKDGVRQPDFNFFLKVDAPLLPLITELTGITDAMLSQDGIDPDEAYKQLSEYIENLPLIGHNSINFDRLFLEKACQLYRLPIPDPKRHIDTAMIYKAMKLEDGPYFYEDHYQFAKRIGQIRASGVKFKLTLACQELGIDISHLTAHQSDSDIEMTKLLYDHLINTF